MRHRVGEEADKQCVVIAKQADHPFVGFRHPRQARDDAGRIGAAVGVVADMDDAVVGRRAAGEVGGDLLMRLGQHGVAAVHVADGVEPHALRSACLAQSHSSFSRSFGRHGRATTSWKWIATMRVLVIENYFGTTLGQVGAALDEAGITTDIRRVWNGSVLPDGPNGYDGLVVLGGEQSAVDDAEHPYLPRVAALTKAFGEADKAVLGICLGAQLVARGHGARNILGRPIEFGWQKVVPTEAGRRDPVLSALGEGAPLFHWHLDTFTLPPGADPSGHRAP